MHLFRKTLFSMALGGALLGTGAQASVKRRHPVARVIRRRCISRPFLRENEYVAAPAGQDRVRSTGGIASDFGKRRRGSARGPSVFRSASCAMTPTRAGRLDRVRRMRRDG